jgi:YD repeat-containing protein
MKSQIARILSATLISGAMVLTPVASVNAAPSKKAGQQENGVVRVRSAYGMQETIDRLKADVANKGIMFFALIDQSKLAADAGISLRPSALLTFGNPGLGSHFITSNPAAGLDWPVRLLVYTDAQGTVWAAYTDFDYIARRHRIADRKEAFAMASKVIASITASVAAK